MFAPFGWPINPGTKHKTKVKQRGHGFRPAGSKLARKAARSRVGARVVGVVSAALENIAKAKRR